MEYLQGAPSDSAVCSAHAAELIAGFRETRAARERALRKVSLRMGGAFLVGVEF